jgi:hypothetical protein
VADLKVWISNGNLIFDKVNKCYCFTHHLLRYNILSVSLCQDGIYHKSFEDINKKIIYSVTINTFFFYFNQYFEVL